MTRTISSIVAILLIVFPLTVCTGGVGWAQTVDFMPSYARMSVSVMSGSPVGAAGCTTPSGDELSESFGEGDQACISGGTGDNASCSATWVVPAVTPSFTGYTFKHALQSGAPTGSCDHGLRFVATTNANRERIYWDRGSAIGYATTTVIKFSIYINSNGLDAGNVLSIVSFASTNEGAGTGSLMLKKSAAGGTTELYFQGDANNQVVALETWYEVTIYLHETASYGLLIGGGLTLCDANNECDFTRGTTDYRYLVIGKNSYTAFAFDFEIGYLTINTP